MSIKPKSNILLRCISISGGFLINFPLGLVWYYGNLSTYTNSYFLYKIGKKAFNVQPDWLLSVCVVSYVVGILTVDWLVSRFNTKVIQLTAIVIFNVCTFLTYFTVQHSVGLVLFSFMICVGYSSGVAGMISLVYARKVMPEHVGLASAVVSSAYGLGAIVNNYAITAYINPRNLTPDMRQTNMAYFSQAEVIDNVPGVFIVTGIISSAYHFLGYLLEQLPLLYFPITEEKSVSADNEEKEPITWSDLPDYNSGQSSVSSREDINAPDVNKTKTCVAAEDQCSNKDTENGLTLKPSQVLRERSLHLLWLSMGALTYGIMLTQNFFKLFGQLWIKNDAFLTTIGSFVAVSNGVFRIMFGFIVDRIGVKSSVILILSMNSIMLIFWYIAPILNRWFYFFCCQILTGVQGTIYVMFPMAALKLYGPTYYASNFGLILVANVVADLLCPVIFSYLQDEYGWFSMVLVGSVLSTVALVSVVFLMPEGREKYI